MPDIFRGKGKDAVSLRFPYCATALAAVAFIVVPPAAAPRAVVLPVAAGLAAVGGARSTGAALVNDGILSLVLFLVLLLAMSLFAVIRLPRWDGASSGEDARPAPPAPVPPAPAPAWPAPAWPAQPVPRPAGRHAGGTPAPSVPAATRQSGQTDPAAGPARGPLPEQGTVRQPKMSGGPPWEPAPKPSDPLP